MDNTLYHRFTEKILGEALQDTPVVLIHGSRQCGNTTLAYANHRTVITKSTLGKPYI